MARRAVLTTKSGRAANQLGTHVLEILQARAPQALDLAAGQYERKTKLLLSQRGHGRIYRRGGKFHQASAPGEVPARDMGALVRSIGWRRIRRFSRRMGTGSKVGLYLDKGSRRVLPRPWVLRSINASLPAMKIALRIGFRG